MIYFMKIIIMKISDPKLTISPIFGMLNETGHDVKNGNYEVANHVQEQTSELR